MSPKKTQHQDDFDDDVVYDDEDAEETSEDDEDDAEEADVIIDDNDDIVSFVAKTKGKNMAKEEIRPITADDYFAIYPQDRRSREEITTLLERNKEYLKKLSGNSKREEKKKALLVAVHVDFENRVQKLTV